MIFNFFLHRKIFGVFIFLFMHTMAFSQEAMWPVKPVKIVVPFSPGGASDFWGRLIATGLAEMFNQSFIVENKPGAGGVLGSQVVSKLAPDGYTLVISGIASHVIAPLENPKIYDPKIDFTHLAILGGPPVALAVNANGPFSDFNKFLELAQGSVSAINWGSPGQSTHGYLTGESFEVLTKTPMQHIPYKGAAPAMVDLAAGHIQASFTTLSSASTQIKSGKIRLLAVSSGKRLATLPGVPTFAELGYPTLTGVTWFSLSGPPGMPSELVGMINSAVRKLMKSPLVQEQLIKASMETFDLDAPRVNTFIAAEVKKWSQLVMQIKSE